MSGHSKWSTIKRQKGKTDAQRGKIFTKIGREIAVAVKAGGSDPNTNSKLRDIIAKARSNNMPNENITRSIKKAVGETSSINYESIVYEGYGVNGIAVIVECLTDNKNRTASEIRHIFDRNGGSMGTSGCVSYMFESKGIFIVVRSENTTQDEDDDLMMYAIDNGAEDFATYDDYYEIVCALNDFNTLLDALQKRAYTFNKCAIERIPATTVDVSDEDLPKFNKMISLLEDNDDVQEVFHNALIPQEEDED